MTDTNPADRGPDPHGDAYWTRPRRLDDDRIIGGVAAGLSAWLGVPVVAVRLAFVIAALLNGIGVLVYVALWFAMPVDGNDEPSRVRIVVAAVFAGSAALLILERFDLPRSGILLPLLLVGIGVALWQRNPPRRPRSPMPTQRSTTEPASLTDAEPTATRTTSTRTRREWRGRRVARVSRERRPFSPLARIGVALAFAALAIALLADRGDVFDLTMSRGASLLLVVLGAVLFVGARYGHARSLTVLALPVALFLPVASTFDDLDVDPFRHMGSRTYYADDVSSSLAPTYRNGLGNVTLDLRDLDRNQRAYRTTVRTAVGSIDVYVPNGPQVVLRARVGAGTIRVDDFPVDPATGAPARRIRAVDADGRDLDRTTILPGDPGAGSIEIDAASGLGSIRVVRLGPIVMNRPPPVPTVPPATTIPSATTIGPATTVAPATSETR